MKKTRDFEDDRDRRRREKDQEAILRDQKKAKRDKEKRRDAEAKSRSKFSPYIEDDSDSEIDSYRQSHRREVPSRSKYDDVPASRRSREEPRKGSKYDVWDEDSDLDLNDKIKASKEHIIRTTGGTVDIEPRRAGRSRGTSDLRPQKKTSPPPAPAELSKRPPARRGQTSRAPSPKPLKKDKRSPTIVDPESTRKPSLPTAASESRSMKSIFSSSRGEPRRSATYQPTSDFKQPPMRRSETMPINRMRPSGTVPLKTSHLQNMVSPSDDSGSSDSDSSMTEDDELPPMRSSKPPLPPKATAYRVRQDEERHILEPQEAFPPRYRETSPKSRWTPDRPAMAARGATTHSPSLSRANTGFPSPKDDRSPRPGLSRTEAARPTPPKSGHREKQLFHEIVPEEPFRPRQSSRTYAEDLPYTGRRGSGDISPDHYTGSRFSDQRRRPQMSRNGVSVY